MRQKVIYVVIFFVFSCVEDSNIVFSEININTKSNTIVEVNIPKAEGKEAVINNINTAIRNVVSANLQFNSNENTTVPIEQSINTFNAEYKSFKSEFPESLMVWDAQIDGEVLYQSNAIITVAITAYTNTGGAHGNTLVSLLNFDALTGQSLKNNELINNMKAFKKLAEKQFKADIKDKKAFYFDPDNFMLPENIGYHETGIVLLYNNYEIAPYSTGLTKLTIPYKTVSEYLNYL